MALDYSLKTGLLDISVMHILRKKKQSPKRTAKKILDTFYSIYPETNQIPENTSDFSILVALTETNDFLGIRAFLLNRL